MSQVIDWNSVLQVNVLLSLKICGRKRHNRVPCTFLVLAHANQRPFAHFLTEFVRPFGGKQKCRVLIELQPDDNSTAISELLCQGTYLDIRVDSSEVPPN